MTLEEMLEAANPKNSVEDGLFLATFTPARIRKLLRVCKAAKTLTVRAGIDRADWSEVMSAVKDLES